MSHILYVQPSEKWRKYTQDKKNQYGSRRYELSYRCQNERKGLLRAACLENLAREYQKLQSGQGQQQRSPSVSPRPNNAALPNASPTANTRGQGHPIPPTTWRRKHKITMTRREASYEKVTKLLDPMNYHRRENQI
jgi:hypothetical protein